MNSLIDCLARCAEQQPDAPLFAFYDGRGRITDSYSCADFHRRTNHLARFLTDETGVKPGNPVVLVYAPGLEFAAAFFACAKIGAIPVPAPPPSFTSSRVELNRLAHVVHDSGSRVIASDGVTARQLAKLIVEASDDSVTSLLEHTWVETDAQRDFLDDFSPASSDVLFLQYTSGSTADPKGVVISHRNVIHNCSLLVQHDDPVGVSWLPHYHDMGLIGFYLFAPVTGGTAHCFSPIDFLRRPRLWFDLITRHRGTITSAPNFAYDHCLQPGRVSDEAIAEFDLSSMQVMMNGAEPVRAATVDGFFKRYSKVGLRREALVCGYGLAEHTLGVTTGGTGSIEVSREALETGHTLVPASQNGSGNRTTRLMSCGRPRPDVDIAIVDNVTHTQSAEGEIGEIWVDSPSKANGYWCREDESAGIFEALSPDPANGKRYLRTGDMGALLNGELYVCGRLKDMIIVRGQNVYPSDVEAAIEAAHETVAAGTTAVFAEHGLNGSGQPDERFVVLIERPRQGAAPEPRHVAHSVRLEFACPPHAVAIVPRGTIPRTSSGKIARTACAELWRRGELDVISRYDVLDRIASQTVTASSVMELLDGQGEAASDTPLEALGLDSIELVNLSLYLEERLKRSGAPGMAALERLQDLRVLQSLTFGGLRDIVAALEAPGSAGNTAVRLADKALRDVQGGEREFMRRDAVLADDIRPSDQPGERLQDCLFLTGATGFLGRYLLAELLTQTDSRIAVLVRGKDQVAADARLRAVLVDADLWQGEVAEAYPVRVEVLAGDLTLKRFGLNDAHWRMLCDRVEAIYHCGADVDYVKTYGGLREANVVATEQTIRLACTGPCKTLHHISTTFIFGWSVFALLRETTSNARMKDLDFGYAQTKWVSEQLVLKARERGLDARIYRPSLVTASAQGHYSRHDITARVLGYMIRHGVAVDTPNQVSFLPVDHTACNLVAISRTEPESEPTYHVTAGEYYGLVDVCEILSRDFGFEFEFTDIDGFIAHANAHCDAGDDLYPLVPFLNRNGSRIHRMRNKRYDNRNYRAATRDADGASVEPELADIMRWIVEFLRSEGLVNDGIGRPGKHSATDNAAVTL